MAPYWPFKGLPIGSLLARQRVLGIHGHAQSASRFKGKIAAMTKEVKSLAEFDFIDGPFVVPHCGHFGKPLEGPNRENTGEIPEALKWATKYVFA